MAVHDDATEKIDLLALLDVMGDMLNRITVSEELRCVRTEHARRSVERTIHIHPRKCDKNFLLLVNGALMELGIDAELRWTVFEVKEVEWHRPDGSVGYSRFGAAMYTVNMDERDED